MKTKDLAALAAKWRERANDFAVTRGDSEVEAAYYYCAGELELALAETMCGKPIAGGLASESAEYVCGKKAGHRGNCRRGTKLAAAVRTEAIGHN